MHACTALLPTPAAPSAPTQVSIQTLDAAASLQLLSAVLPVRLLQSSEPRCALGAVRRLCAAAGTVVVLLVRYPEKHVIDDQNEGGHRHAEEISDGHRHFHPDLAGHVGVFGPQFTRIARPPLHVSV